MLFLCYSLRLKAYSQIYNFVFHEFSNSDIYLVKSGSHDSTIVPKCQDAPNDIRTFCSESSKISGLEYDAQVTKITDFNFIRTCIFTSRLQPMLHSKGQHFHFDVKTLEYTKTHQFHTMTLRWWNRFTPNALIIECIQFLKPNKYVWGWI